MNSKNLARLTALFGGALFASSCGGHDCPRPNVDLAVCDASNMPFSLTIDNPYFPVVVGDQVILEGGTGSRAIRIETTVLDQIMTVAGVATRVVEERTLEAGTLVAVVRHFYAQAPDGTVCRFGAEVDEYRGGVIVGHDGAWRAEGPNHAGIAMPATPTVGMVFETASAPGVADDRIEIRALDAVIETPAGTFTNAIEAERCDPGDGSTDRTYYASNVGLVADDAAEAVSY